MAGASSRIPKFRSAEYWAALEPIANELISTSANHPLPSAHSSARVLQQLSNRGFGYVSLFDLCAMLVLAAPRAPTLPDASAPGTALTADTEPEEAAPPAGSEAELARGPVTVSAHPTERHKEHLRNLEAAVAGALLISPSQPRARSVVQRALAARGNTVRDATAVYGIVCDLLAQQLSEGSLRPRTPSD